MIDTLIRLEHSGMQQTSSGPLRGPSLIIRKQGGSAMLPQILYAYRMAAPAEKFVKKIEDAGFKVATVSTLNDTRRLIEAYHSTFIGVIIEKGGGKDFQDTINLLKWVNLFREENHFTAKFFVLVLSLIEESDEVIAFYEDEAAHYVNIKDVDPNGLIAKIKECCRAVQKSARGPRMRIVIIDGSVRSVWVKDSVAKEKELILSAKLGELLMYLIVNRYATSHRIAKALHISARSAKMYILRIRDAWDDFNAKCAHLPYRGKDVFKTFKFADETLFRIVVNLTLDKKTASGINPQAA
jgi:hypothetical protein